MNFVRVCPTRKKRYLTLTDAYNAAARLRKSGLKRQVPYICPHCLNFHLTRLTKPKPAPTT